MLFFSLSDWALVLIVLAVVAGVTAAGIVLGRNLRKHSETLREPLGVAQGALLGVVALILAFGLTLAVGRYEDRRAAVVAEANAIGTTYLRAQLLAEPVRDRSLALLRDYTDLALRISSEVPGSPAMARTITAENTIQGELWGLAGQAIDAAPVASAPRLYVDSLNTTIDEQTVRLGAQQPSSGRGHRGRGDRCCSRARAARSLPVRARRGLVPMLLGALLITVLLLVTFDLDRPTRGLITVPSTPLQSLRASMELPPAASPPP